MTDRDRLVAAARTQLGVRYYSMHWGPKGSKEPGWGCAMFVAYCYKSVLGTNYVGSCYNYAGDCLGQSVNQGGGQFKFISAEDALPGDAVLYGAAGYNGKDYDDYGHIALYVGNGRVIGAMGRGVPGASNYLNIGIKETSVAAQNIGGVTRYIRCTRLSDADTDKEAFPMEQTITVKSDSVAVRTAPSTRTGKVVTSNGKPVRYTRGQTFRIDGVRISDGYVWGTYIGASSGQRRYVALGPTSIAGV